MFAVEVNGVRLEAATEKEAKRLMSKAVKQAKKEEADRDRKYAVATMKARAAAWRVLERKASGEEMPRGWRYYTPADDWSKWLFQPHAGERDCRNQLKMHTLCAEDGNVVLDHYGNDLLGACCNGAGHCWLIFLQDYDCREQPPMCFAIGVEGDMVALAECPGVKITDFQAKEQP